MANALGTLASGLIIQQALALVFPRRPLLKAISLDLSDEKCKFNQSITSRTFGIPTVNNFGTGATDRADTDVPVTISAFKEIHHKFTIQEITSTDRNLVMESAEPIAVAIANHMVGAIAALWTAANFPTVTTLAAGWDYEHLTDVRAVLNGPTRNVPDATRFYVGNSDVYKSFLNDPLIVAEMNNARNGAAIESGRLPVVSGFQIDEYAALPANAENLCGFAGTKDSAVLATRIPRDPRELLPNAPFPGVLEAITDPTTGFTVLVNEWIDPTTLAPNVRIIWMYGVAKGNANNGQRIRTGA